MVALRPDVAAARSAAPRARTPAAFDELVRDHEPALRAFALRLTGSGADASDLTQDCLERALRRFDTFTPGTNPRAWLLAILHHAFIDRCRRRSVDKGAEDIDRVEVQSPEPLEPPAWTRITPEQLASAIDRLDADFRDVYRMHAEGRSYQEIAARLAIPLNTVGTRLSRARSKLRKILDAILDEGGTP